MVNRKFGIFGKLLPARERMLLDGEGGRQVLFLCQTELHNTRDIAPREVGTSLVSRRK